MTDETVWLEGPKLEEPIILNRVQEPLYKNNNVPAPTCEGWWWLRDASGSEWRIYSVLPGSSQRMFDLLNKDGRLPEGDWTGPIPEPAKPEEGVRLRTPPCGRRKSWAQVATRRTDTPPQWRHD